MDGHLPPCAGRGNLKTQTILPLALASLVFGCGGQPSTNEAGLLDAVAFVIGGQQEGAIPQGFETRWSVIRTRVTSIARSPAITRSRLIGQRIQHRLQIECHGVAPRTFFKPMKNL
jgi:hypothetical protein